MITFIAAAALAAQPMHADRANPNAHQHMQMGQSDEHKDMDCCKDCCKDMPKKHEGHTGQ